MQRWLPLLVLGALGAGCEPDPCDTEDAWLGNAFVREMEDLDDLEGIQCITGSLIIGEMDHNPSLTGTGIQDIELSASIFHVDGLEDLHIIEGDLHIAGNLALLNLDGLSGLTHVGRELRFEKNPRGDLIIHQNALLGSLDGLGALEAVGANLIISANDFLTDVGGLDALSTVGWEFKIIDNPRLERDDAQAAGDGVAALGGLILSDNGTALE